MPVSSPLLSALAAVWGTLLMAIPPALLLAGLQPLPTVGVVFFSCLLVPYTVAGMVTQTRRSAPRDRGALPTLADTVHALHLAVLCFNGHPSGNPLAEYILLLFLEGPTSPTACGGILYAIGGGCVALLPLALLTRSPGLRTVTVFLYRVGYLFLVCFVASAFKLTCPDVHATWVGAVGVAALVAYVPACCVQRHDAVEHLLKAACVVIAVLSQAADGGGYAVGIVAPYTVCFGWMLYRDTAGTDRGHRDTFSIVVWLTLVGVSWVGGATRWASWTLWWGWIIAAVVVLVGAVILVVVATRCCLTTDRLATTSTIPVPPTATAMTAVVPPTVHPPLAGASLSGPQADTAHGLLFGLPSPGPLGLLTPKAAHVPTGGNPLSAVKAPPTWQQHAAAEGAPFSVAHSQLSTPTATQPQDKVVNPLVTLRVPPPLDMPSAEDALVDVDVSQATPMSRLGSPIATVSTMRDVEYDAHCEELRHVMAAAASPTRALAVLAVPDVTSLGNTSCHAADLATVLAVVGVFSEAAWRDTAAMECVERLRVAATAPVPVHAFLEGIKAAAAAVEQPAAAKVVATVKKPTAVEVVALSSNGACWDANENCENLQLYCPGGYHPTTEGEVFNGRYVAVKKLGWGEFSIVWLATDIGDTSRRVALKISRANAVYQAASSNEIQVCGAVKAAAEAADKKEGLQLSQCVMAMLDTFNHRGPNGTHLVCVLECLGPNLLSLMTATSFKGLQLRVVKQVARSVLRGLAFLHESVGIIHADLKPENVLLVHDAAADATKGLPFEERYLVKISDLGSGRLVTGKYPMCTLQTREYRAPEVILGCESLMGPAMDVWSLACMCFELLTGDFLFDPKSQVQADQQQDILHVNMVMQMMGKVPDRVIGKAKKARQFFSAGTGAFVQKPLARVNLADVMSQTYKMAPKDAKEVADFLLPMLAIDPSSRVTARAHMTHKWLDL